MKPVNGLQQILVRLSKIARNVYERRYEKKKKQNVWICLNSILPAPFSSARTDLGGSSTITEQFHCAELCIQWNLQKVNLYHPIINNYWVIIHCSRTCLATDRSDNTSEKSMLHARCVFTKYRRSYLYYSVLFTIHHPLVNPRLCGCYYVNIC